MTTDTYWKLRALFALMQLAQITLRDTTALLHQTLEANGLPVDTPMRFDDQRQTIQPDQVA